MESVSRILVALLFFPIFIKFLKKILFGEIMVTNKEAGEQLTTKEMPLLHLLKKLLIQLTPC
jgi:hypothetical protein